MSTRTERVARAVQEELGQLLPQLKDPRVAGAGLITVTHVRVSPDLGQARVLVSLWGGDPQKGKDLIVGLDRSRGFLEREIGRRMHSKRVPHLTFVLDDTAERAGKVDQIFAELDAERRAREAEAPRDAAPAEGGDDAEAPDDGDASR